MHRAISITTMAALLSTLVLPAMPNSHAGNGTRVVCHRAPVTRIHQCAEMEITDDSHPEGRPAESTVFGSNETGNCPMDCCCCVQANSGKNSVLVPAHQLFAAVDVQDETQSHSIVFRSRGFSSHTDRGPPSLHA